MQRTKEIKIAKSRIREKIDENFIYIMGLFEEANFQLKHNSENKKIEEINKLIESMVLEQIKNFNYYLELDKLLEIVRRQNQNGCY